MATSPNAPPSKDAETKNAKSKNAKPKDRVTAAEIDASVLPGGPIYRTLAYAPSIEEITCESSTGDLLVDYKPNTPEGFTVSKIESWTDPETIVQHTASDAQQILHHPYNAILGGTMTVRTTIQKVQTSTMEFTGCTLQVPPNLPLHWWQMNDDDHTAGEVEDVRSHNVATLVGGATIDDDDFEAEPDHYSVLCHNSKLETEPIDLNQATDFTVFGRMKVPQGAAQARNYIFDTCINANTDPAGFRFFVDGHGEAIIYFQFQGAGAVTRVQGVDHDWHSYAAVINGNGLKLFFDGVLLASEADISSFTRTTQNDAPCSMGGRVLSPNGHCLIADVRLWNRALTDAQVVDAHEHSF